MSLRRRSPFGVLRELEQHLNESLPDQDGDSSQSSITSWSPKVDVFEESNNLVFELEAPGVSKDDIDISIEDNRLTIQGERSDESVQEDRDYYRSERFYGTFQRSFALPEPINAEDVTAEYNDGVLEISVPTTDRAGSQSIDIQ